MKLDFHILLQALFPLSDDERLIADCTPDVFTKKLEPQQTGCIMALSYFSDEQVRAAIHLVKFHNNTHALQLLSTFFASWVNSLKPQQYMLVPIPLSAQRMSERGYNQVESIVRKAMARLPYAEINAHVLKKTRHTKPQTSLTRQERKKNLTGVFTVDRRYGAKLKGKHIILVDDVSTTGATLMEARAALMKYHPRSLQCVALAH